MLGSATCCTITDCLLRACHAGDLQSLEHIFAAEERAKSSSSPAASLDAGVLVNAIEQACKHGQTHIFPAFLRTSSRLAPFVDQAFSHSVQSVARRGEASVLAAILMLKREHEANYVADVHVCGDVALRMACARGQVACARMLLQLAGDRTPDVDSGTHPGFRAACRTGEIGIISMMLALPEHHRVPEHLTFGLRVALTEGRHPSVTAHVLLTAHYHSPTVVLGCMKDVSAVKVGSTVAGIPTHRWLAQRAGVWLGWGGGGAPRVCPPPDVPDFDEFEESYQPRDMDHAVPVCLPVLALGQYAALVPSLSAAAPQLPRICDVFVVISAWLARTLLAGGEDADVVRGHLAARTQNALMPPTMQAWIGALAAVTRWYGCASMMEHGTLPPSALRLHTRVLCGRRAMCLHRHRTVENRYRHR